MHRRAQHHPGAVRGVQRAALPGPARLRPRATPTSACCRPAAYANAAAQDILLRRHLLHDHEDLRPEQHHNDLPISWGGYWKGPGANGADVGADATALPVTVGGHQAYGVKVTPGVGYRVDNATERADRLPARGHLHGHLVELRQPVVLLRLRQRRELAHRHRQRHDERDLLGHRLLVRRLHRHRPVGRGRPGERHVPHRTPAPTRTPTTRASTSRSSAPGRRTTAPATSPSNTATPPAAG